MKLAFYTCFYGDDNNIAFSVPETSLKYDCYYFTNNKRMFNCLEKTKWIGVYDNKPVTDDLTISAMLSKRVKSMPENYEQLQNYDYLCYIDSKLSANERLVESQIEEYFIKQKYAILLKKHWMINNNVWNEFNGCMNQDRYRLEGEKYINYIISQVRNGLSEKSDDHVATCYLLRNMKHPKITEINKRWFNHIQICGIECQISFFFVKQMFSNYILSF